MDDSITTQLLAHIGRLEAELASLRRTIAGLGTESSEVSPSDKPVDVAVLSVPPAAVTEPARQVHKSGLERSQGDFLQSVFAAALISDVEERWEALGELTHSSAMLGPRSVEYLKAFNWKQLVKNASSYLQGDAPDSYKVTRSEPADSIEATKVKIFLKPSDGRHPAPILLERDAAKGGGWKITQISL
jgi:hypothetical protein